MRDNKLPRYTTDPSADTSAQDYINDQLPSREAAMVTITRDENGVPKIFCDPEIVDLVAALNSGGVPTVASCSGHGERNGNIALKDGRELIIANSYEDARRIERLI